MENETITISLPAVLVPAHSLAVLASVRFLLQVLEGDGSFTPEGLIGEPTWIASVVGGAYVHKDREFSNVHRVHQALNHTAGINVSIRSARALVADISGRIG